jgi:hypothetical protein
MWGRAPSPVRLAQRGLFLYTAQALVVLQFGLRIRPVEREIPFGALRLLRAGSSLRLGFYAMKLGYAQDDKVV